MAPKKRATNPQPQPAALGQLRAAAAAAHKAAGCRVWQQAVGRVACLLQARAADKTRGNMARDFAGKAIGVWLPDAAFVSMGLEHCIANMYLVPMAMSLGAPITAAQFIRCNLVPSTLGNLLGGSILVASAYACSLGSPGHALQDAWEARLASLAAAWRRRRSGRTASSPSLAAGVPSNGNASAAGSRSSGQDEAVSVEQDSRYQASVQLAANTSGGPLPVPSPRRRAGAAFPTSP